VIFSWAETGFWVAKFCSLPWSWRHKAPPKHWYLLGSLHGVTPHKTEIFVCSDLRKWDHNLSLFFISYILLTVRLVTNSCW